MYKSFKIYEQIKISEMFSLFIIHYNKGFSFPGETHDFWECMYVIRGGVCVSGDERIYNLSDNDIVFHKPLELHKFDVDGENGADLMIFSFSAKGELVDFFKNKVFTLSPEQIGIMNSFIEFLNRNYTFFPAEYKKTTKILERFEKEPFFMNRIAIYLYQLFLSLYDYNAIRKVSENPDAMVFSDAVSYMMNNIGAQLPVESIASYCHISPTGLKRIFNKYAGFSIHKYFLKMKMTEAARLIAEGKSVTEISDMLGFSDQSYFSTCYTRETGLTPSEYRRSLAK